MNNVSPGRGRSRPFILCAALLVVVLGTGAWSIAYRNSHLDHRLAGVHWTLVALRSDRSVQLDRPDAELEFAKGGHFTASDGVNFMTGDYNTSGDRLTMSMNTTTAAASGPSPVVDAMSGLYMHPIPAGDDDLSSDGGATSTYSIAGSLLVITTDEWILTFKAGAS